MSHEMAMKELMALNEEIVKAECDLSRLRATFDKVRSDLNDLKKIGGTNYSFEDAAKHVRTDYTQLLQKLSQ